MVYNNNNYYLYNGSSEDQKTEEVKMAFQTVQVMKAISGIDS